MKTHEITVGEQHRVKRPDPVYTAVWRRPKNKDFTDRGNPLSNVLPPTKPYNAADHVTGTGTGPEYTGHRRTAPVRGWLYQDFVRKMATVDLVPKQEPYMGPSTTPVQVPNRPTKPVHTSPVHYNNPNMTLRDPYPKHVDYSDIDPRPMQYQPAYKAMDWLRTKMFHNPLMSLTKQGPWGGAIAGGLGGMGLGLLGGLAYNGFFAKRESEKKSLLPLMILAGLLGSGIGGGMGFYHKKYGAEKQAFSVYDQPANPVEELIATLASAGLPFNLVQRLIALLKNLSTPEAQQLRMALGGLTGTARTAALLRRFGITGIPGAGLSLAGGLMSANVLGALGNRRGQVMVDMYGNPY